MNFKEVVTIHWESEDGRFIITRAIPDSYCITDTWSYTLNTEYHEHFEKTLEEAKQLCATRFT